MSTFPPPFNENTASGVSVSRIEVTTGELTAAPGQPGPSRRVARTAVQAFLAGCAAVPLAVAKLPLSAGQALWTIGVSSAATILVSAVWNAIDARGQS